MAAGPYRALSEATVMQTGDEKELSSLIDKSERIWLVLYHFRDEGWVMHKTLGAAHTMTFHHVYSSCASSADTPAVVVELFERKTE